MVTALFTAIIGTAFAAVVIDVPMLKAERGWDAMARRLQSAAEKQRAKPEAGAGQHRG